MWKMSGISTSSSTRNRRQQKTNTRTKLYKIIELSVSVLFMSISPYNLYSVTLCVFIKLFYPFLHFFALFFWSIVCQHLPFIPFFPSIPGLRPQILPSETTEWSVFFYEKLKLNDVVQRKQTVCLLLFFQQNFFQPIFLYITVTLYIILRYVKIMFSSAWGMRQAASQPASQEGGSIEHL